MYISFIYWPKFLLILLLSICFDILWFFFDEGTFDYFLLGLIFFRFALAVPNVYPKVHMCCVALRCVVLLCVVCCVVLLYDVFSIGIVSTRVDVILCLFFQRNI